MKPLTVGELRKSLDGVPDDLIVTYVYAYSLHLRAETAWAVGRIARGVNTHRIVIDKGERQEKVFALFDAAAAGWGEGRRGE